MKEAVLPFSKFPEVDVLLGPEMKSTGEVMGIGHSFGEAYFKAQRAAGVILPKSGNVFLSVRDKDKPAVCDIARDLKKIGFELFATIRNFEIVDMFPFQKVIYGAQRLSIMKERPRSSYFWWKVHI